MTTAYSTNLELALPVQGELSGTWGDTVNNGITQYLDTAIAGSQIISGSQTAVTLTNTNGDNTATNIAQAGSGATGTAQYQIIRCTGNPAGLLTITISDTLTAGYSKTFIIINATSTSQSVKIVGSGPTTGITVLSGAKSLVAWNGSDFVEIASSTADGVTTFSAGTTGLTPNTATTGAVTLAGTLGTANGGTGQTSFTSGGVVYASNATTFSATSALQFNGTELGVGVTPIASTPVAIQASTGNTAIRLVGTSSSGTSNAGIYWYDSNNTTFNGYIGNFSTGFDFYNQRNTPIVFYTNAAEKMRLTGAGKLGIGTTAPNNELEVYSSANPSIALTSGSASLYSYFGMTSGTAEGQLYTFGQSYSAVFPAASTVLNNSNFGVVLSANNATGVLTFWTNGTEKARFSSAGGFSVGTTANPGAGAIYATGNITAYYSDARLKTVSGKIENALDKVGKLSGVYYTNNDTAKSFGYDSDEEQVGVIAQEVEAVLPQIVKAAPFDLDVDGNSKPGEHYKTHQYDKIALLLIEAINELQAKVKALEAK